MEQNDQFAKIYEEYSGQPLPVPCQVHWQVNDKRALLGRIEVIRLEAGKEQLRCVFTEAGLLWVIFKEITLEQVNSDIFVVRFDSDSFFRFTFRRDGGLMSRWIFRRLQNAAQESARNIHQALSAGAGNC